MMPGARRGFQAVAHTYVNKGDPVLLTSLSHYTEFLAVEEAGGVACEIPADGRHIVTPELTAIKIEEVRKKFGKNPVLALIDQVDYQYREPARCRRHRKSGAPVRRPGSLQWRLYGRHPAGGRESTGCGFRSRIGPQEHGGTRPLRRPCCHRRAGKRRLPHDRNRRGRDRTEIRYQGAGADGLHAYGRNARGHDGIFSPRKGTGKTFRPGTRKQQDRHGCAALHRRNEDPLRVPAEAYTDPGRYHWIV